MTYTSHGERLEGALAEQIAELRKKRGLTLEHLGELAGAHRTSIGLIERSERGLTIGMAAQLAKALQIELSDLIRRAEDQLEERAPRGAKGAFFNETTLRALTGLDHAQISAAIASSYETVDAIDEQLTRRRKARIAGLVELANLSSLLGNLVGAGIAEVSKGMYKRNLPHSYPDLIGVDIKERAIELKMALESNRPKGHLAKSGCHLTVRYVLTGADGAYARGASLRGDVPTIWEVRVGVLDEHADFDISNTAGDSGKTAVIKTKSLERMAVVYFDEALLPYADVRRYRRNSSLPER